MKVGYARVSTTDQNPALQKQALEKAGCTKVFTDRGVSGATTERPQLTKLLKSLRAGDILVVWKLDRLGRSLPHLLQVIKRIEEMGAGFCSVSENIDTTSASGRLVFHLMGALAEFERALIIERTRAGLQAAKARGVKIGRKRLLDPKQTRHARLLLKGGESPEQVASTLGVSRATLYRALKAETVAI